MPTLAPLASWAAARPPQFNSTPANSFNLRPQASSPVPQAVELGKSVNLKPIVNTSIAADIKGKTKDGKEIRGSVQLYDAEILNDSLKDANGNSLKGQKGVLVYVIVREGLPPGPHGAHIHFGDGSAPPPPAAVAGGHDMNNMGGASQPGTPAKPHAADFPNIVADEDTTVYQAYFIPGVSIERLLSTDGSGIYLAIHEGEDKKKTGTGESTGGDRIAYAQLQPPKAK